MLFRPCSARMLAAEIVGDALRERDRSRDPMAESLELRMHEHWLEESLARGLPPFRTLPLPRRDKVDHERGLFAFPRRIDGSIAVEHRQHRAVGQRIGKTRERSIEIHPVDTRRRNDQSVRRIEWSIFDGGVN